MINVGRIVVRNKIEPALNNIRRSTMASKLMMSRPMAYYVDIKERTNKVALVDGFGAHTYGDLSRNSTTIAKSVKTMLGSKSNVPNKISFLCENDSKYINTLFGIWKAGQVAVPLCKAHPSQTLEYYVNDSESVAIIATESQISKVMPFARDSEKLQLVTYEDMIKTNESSDLLEVSLRFLYS